MTETYQKSELEQLYEHFTNHDHPTRGHLPTLRQLARECSYVTELGVARFAASWGLFAGLSENPYPIRSYVGIDKTAPPSNDVRIAQRVAKENRIAFHFLQANDLQLQISQTELLFIDSLHTYCHLTYELETFSSYVSKYIAMHDTSEPFESADEYPVNFEEYPSFINQKKCGLWPAIEDFLARHPEWALQERYLNSYGLTVLKRVK